MSSSIDTIGHKLQTLEERLQAENESRDCMMLPSQISSGGPPPRGGPRPQHLGEITPTRPKKLLNLPVIQQQHIETETDRKLKKIMKQNGILTIDGRSYQSEIKDLEHIGDLGNGTSGHVVKMKHVTSGAIIAVKQMRRTGNSEENKRILMDLDVVLKSHDCKYIVQCLGCFITDLDVWICMELMAMCFDKLLKLSKMPVPEPILGKVTVATVKALAYLKEKQDVIHRDVKPSNILIDEKGNIKLCDFGISGRLVDSKANTRSAGCAAYMAPERIDPRKPKYDIRADVWSLGITLVELATARSPYEGCKTDFEVLTKVLDSDPPTLPKDEGFSVEFQDFVSKCLRKNHQYRPKYPELLEQPFIKYYEQEFVDVPAWFKSIVEKTGIKPHRRESSPSEICYKKSATTVPAITTSVTASTTTNLNNRSDSFRKSQIPNYQGNNSNNSSNKLYSQTILSSSSPLSSSLPQPVTKTYAYQPLPKETTTTTPIVTTNGYSQQQKQQQQQQQPSDEADIVTQMNKLYKKSPFFQRKSSFSASNNNSNDVSPKSSTAIPLNYGESAKKESVLSSLGQSFIRNLTFSQKKIQNQHQNQPPDGFWKFSNPPDGGGGGGDVDNNIHHHHHSFHHNSIEINNSSKDSTASPSPTTIGGRKRFQTTVPIMSDTANNSSNSSIQFTRPPGSTSPLVFQRFLHQQRQLREKELEEQKRIQQQQHQQHYDSISTNPFLNSYIPKYQYHYPTSSSQSISDGYHSPSYLHGHHQNHHHTAMLSTAAFPDQQQQQQQYQSVHSNQSNSTSSTLSSSSAASSSTASPNHSSNIPIYSHHQLNNSGGINSGYGAQQNNVYSNNLYGRTMTQHNQSQQQQQSTDSKDNNLKDDQGVVKKQFASYVKLHLTAGDKERNNHQQQPQQFQNNHNYRERERDRSRDHRFKDYYRNDVSTSTSSSTLINYNRSPIFRTNLTTTSTSITTSTLTTSTMSTTTTTSTSINLTTTTTCNSLITNSAPSSTLNDGQQSQLHQYRPQLHQHHAISSNLPPSSGIDRRHRSPDPPPRYNRGQSPLLLRKNLIAELCGQPPGSPLLPRRYATASPPLPPPRRGCESVPGSPQHFRTRIHYTPEPQRRVYRTIDQ